MNGKIIKVNCTENNTVIYDIKLENGEMITSVEYSILSKTLEKNDFVKIIKSIDKVIIDDDKMIPVYDCYNDYSVDSSLWMLLLKYN